MTLHKNMTGADLHEPKGIASATSGQVYVATGGGSGSWTTLDLPTGQFYTTVAIFTSSGTWSKPADLIMAEVVCIGGGGGSYYSGGVGGAGTGGTSSFGSHCSAAGGVGGLNTGPGAGGTATGGNENYAGEAGYAAPDLTLVSPGGHAGITISTYGQGARVSSTAGSGSSGGTGGGGACSIKRLKASDLAATESVTVGAGGTLGTGGSAGNGGYVVVRQIIEVP